MEKEQQEVSFHPLEEIYRLRQEANNQRRRQEEERQKKRIFLEEMHQYGKEMQKLRKVVWIRILQGRFREHKEAWDDIGIAIIQSSFRYRGYFRPGFAARLEELEREKARRSEGSCTGYCWWIPFRKTKENILTWKAGKGP